MPSSSEPISHWIPKHWVAVNHAKINWSIVWSATEIHAHKIIWHDLVDLIIRMIWSCDMKRCFPPDLYHIFISIFSNISSSIFVSCISPQFLCHFLIFTFFIQFLPFSKMFIEIFQNIITFPIFSIFVRNSHKSFIFPVMNFYDVFPSIHLIFLA